MGSKDYQHMGCKEKRRLRDHLARRTARFSIIITRPQNDRLSTYGGVKFINIWGVSPSFINIWGVRPQLYQHMGCKGLSTYGVSTTSWRSGRPLDYSGWTRNSRRNSKWRAKSLDPTSAKFSRSVLFAAVGSGWVECFWWLVLACVKQRVNCF